QDAYLRARRVSQFLEPLCTDVEEAAIPSNSLFREFIGGSDYAY
ncbi:MAG: response regulator SirA, partial [Verrucomicrobia bacterium]